LVDLSTCGLDELLLVLRGLILGVLVSVGGVAQDKHLVKARLGGFELLSIDAHLLQFLVDHFLVEV